MPELPALNSIVRSISTNTLLRDPRAAADDLDHHVLLHDRAAFFDHVLFEQMHQEIEFLGRAFPVLAGQAVQRQLLHPQPRTFLHGSPDARHSTPVPFNPWQILALCPAPVAVHNDGNMPGALLARHVLEHVGSVGG